MSLLIKRLVVLSTKKVVEPNNEGKTNHTTMDVSGVNARATNTRVAREIFKTTEYEN